VDGAIPARSPRASGAGILDPATLTCIANDFGYDDVFARQVEAHGRAGDLLVAISTSGESTNIVRAVEAAKRAVITTVGLLGRGGGRLRDQVDIPVVVPLATTSDRIQEVHIRFCTSSSRWWSAGCSPPTIRTRDIDTRGAAAALAAAMLFGFSAPCAKRLLADTHPLLLSGLLYLGAGTGLLLLPSLATGVRTRAETPLRRGDLGTLVAIVGLGHPRAAPHARRPDPRLRGRRGVAVEPRSSAHDDACGSAVSRGISVDGRPLGRRSSCSAS